MSVPRKFPAVSWLFAVLCPIALAAGGHEATPKASTPAAVVAQDEQTVSHRKPSDFCLPGEKLVCTLGPPPVCHCE